MAPTLESIEWLSELATRETPPAVLFSVLVERGFALLEQIDQLRRAGLRFFERDGGAYVLADEFVSACQSVASENRPGRYVN